MKTGKRVLIAALVIAAMVLIPSRVANAYWAPGASAWRTAYVYDPAYRFGPAWQRAYIRDLYRRGPDYANWRRARRHGWWW